MAGAEVADFDSGRRRWDHSPSRAFGCAVCEAAQICPYPPLSSLLIRRFGASIVHVAGPFQRRVDPAAVRTGGPRSRWRADPRRSSAPRSDPLSPR
jgi:hypothetical protein